MELWYPNAKRVILPGQTGLAPLDGRPKIVLHTTEGRSIEGAESAYRASGGDAPNFTISPNTVHQHIPLSMCAYSLEHPRGTAETNRAGHVVQIEQVGLAAEAGDWSDAYYDDIRALVHWIHKQNGTPLAQISDGIAADFTTPQRIPASRFAHWSGVCGHVHVPNQPAGHTDPGRRFHIGKVI